MVAPQRVRGVVPAENPQTAVSEPRYNGGMRGKLLTVALGFTLAACGDPNPGPSAPGTGGSGQGGAGGTGGAGGSGGSGTASNGGSSGAGGTTAVCNDLVADAPGFLLSNDPGPAPVAKGGTIVDGTYFATGETLYETSSILAIDMGSAKVVISGSSWQEVDGWPSGGVNPDKHVTATFSTSGTTLALNRTCPSATQEVVGFTADAQGFSLFGKDSGAAFGVVFARQ